MDKFEIHPLNPETLALYKNCFDQNGSPKNAQNIEWQFFKNTPQSAFVDILVDSSENKAAAIYAVSCVHFKMGNSTVVGAQSLDTITDVNYRGQGHFINLAKDVYQKAADAGTALVYGFPNGNSIHGFKKKLEWEVLDPVPFLIKPLQSGYFTKKIPGLKWLPSIPLSFKTYKAHKGFSIREDFAFPTEVDALWKAFSVNIPVALQRDKPYLDWRYIAKPHENYQIAHCYDARNQYLGFVVFAVKKKHGGSIGYVLELIYDLENPMAGQKLLEYAVSKMRPNADCILSWSFAHSPNHNVYKKSFFMTLPERLRPIELHFGARAFNDKYKTLIENRQNWFLSYSDSDTV